MTLKVLLEKCFFAVIVWYMNIKFNAKTFTLFSCITLLFSAIFYINYGSETLSKNKESASQKPSILEDNESSSSLYYGTTVNTLEISIMSSQKEKFYIVHHNQKSAVEEKKLRETILPEEQKKKTNSEIVSKEKAPVKENAPVPKKTGIAAINTITDAEEYASKRWKYTSFSFIGMDIGCARETLYALSRFESEFPGLIDRGLNYIGTMKDKPAIAHNGTTDPFPDGSLAFYSIGSAHIGLDPKDFNNYNNLSSRRRKTVASGLNPVGGEKPRAIVMHELGHFLDYWTKRNSNDLDKSAIQQWKSDNFNESDSVKREVSRYALANPEEMFSETLVQTMYKPAHSKLSRNMEKALNSFKEEVHSVIASYGPPIHRDSF